MCKNKTYYFTLTTSFQILYFILLQRSIETFIYTVQCFYGHFLFCFSFFLLLSCSSGSASTPVIKVISNVSSRVVLQCESAGWYPEPELLWLDGEGNLLSAGPTETLRGPDDLYTVSSRVTVEKRHSNNITCRVQQRNTNQSRETHKHVPGNND